MPVQFVQCVIPDDPAFRRNAVADTVLKHCSNVLFPHKKATSLCCADAAAHDRGKNGNHYTLSDNSNGSPDEKSISKHSLVVNRLSGGITNELFHVYHPEDRPNSVIFRVFGKETERVISRESELFYQSFFISTYVRGPNFLIYEFLDKHEPLPFTDMPLEHKKIARALAAFQVKATMEARRDYHKLLVVDEASRMYWDSVGPTLGGSYHAHNRHPSDAFDWSRFDREENYTMHAFSQWVEQLLSEGIRSKLREDRREQYDNVAQQLQQEVIWIVGILNKHASEMGEGVCHNDLLSANIMRNTTDGSLKIIDFDYVKRNYLLFDIANHFNEYTGLECDYKRYFPSDDQMTKFIAVYRQAMRDELRSHAEEARRCELDEIIPDQKRLFFISEDQEEHQRIACWVKLAKLLTLASNLSWSIWALLQEAVSDLEMDFLEYSKLRLARFVETKAAFSAGF